jgi:hypothetical protein
MKATIDVKENDVCSYTRRCKQFKNVLSLKKGQKSVPQSKRCEVYLNIV